MQITELTISEAAARLAKGDLSAVELTQGYIDRIARVDPELKCFITLTPEFALQQARRADRAFRQGGGGGLTGIPMGLKDLFETHGVRTTAGSLFFAEYIPTADGPVVEKLSQAGAVLLGKLNMHEIALGVTNVNPHYGACRNPWDLQRVSGGSSGGCAAALAARLCSGALGSDTGGSIRIPAALCGVVGLKPTYGRVSLRGVIPLSWSLDHPGPMARTVRDAALLLQAIAGYDPLDPVCRDAEVPDFLEMLEAGVHGWRVGVAADEYFIDPESVAPEVVAAVRAAMQVFEGLGAHVEEVAFPAARLAAQTNGMLVVTEAAVFHRERLQTRPQDFGADVRQRLEQGAANSLTDYALARRTQVELRREFERFFEHYDVLLTPTTPIPAPLREGTDAVEQARRLTRFTAPFNLTGLPALSLPCGFTAEGLPLGLQIVSRPWAETAILRAGHAYEQATEWHLRRPSLDEDTPISD